MMWYFFICLRKKTKHKRWFEHIKAHLPEVTCNLHPDETPNVWDVDCTVVMTPSHQAIVKQEEAFDKIVTQLKGYTDGWGIEA